MMELAGACTMGVRRTASMSRPLTMDQLAMPAEERQTCSDSTSRPHVRTNSASHFRTPQYGTLATRT